MVHSVDKQTPVFVLQPAHAIYLTLVGREGALVAAGTSTTIYIATLPSQIPA